MSYQNWIFSLHLLTAATLVGGFVMSWIVVVALYSTTSADETLSFNRVATIANIAIVLGLPGTIALGIWLAILRPEFRPWDGWIIAAIILWAIATAAVLRSFAEYQEPVARSRELVAAGRRGASEELATLNRAFTGLLFRAAGSVAIVLIVIDMIYKPGA